MRSGFTTVDSNLVSIWSTDSVRSFIKTTKKVTSSAINISIRTVTKSVSKSISRN